VFLSVIVKRQNLFSCIVIMKNELILLISVLLFFFFIAQLDLLAITSFSIGHGFLVTAVSVENELVCSTFKYLVSMFCSSCSVLSETLLLPQLHLIDLLRVIHVCLLYSSSVSCMNLQWLVPLLCSSVVDLFS